jgi:DNA-binding HxlR family transcriptional regulator
MSPPGDHARGDSGREDTGREDTAREDTAREDTARGAFERGVYDYRAYDSDTCSIARTLALIGDRWTLLVLRDVANGVRRFDELATHLGIARNILSRRLAALTGHGLVERRAYREPGERVRHEYRLSRAGRELMPVLLAFMDWGDRHLAGPEGPPAVARHAGCGARLRISVTCEEGHDLGDRPRLRLEPGPGSRRIRA